jgi:Fe-S-cluster containining protein
VTAICALCAFNGTSCCQNFQIPLTDGDVLRISTYRGNRDFLSVEPPVPEEIEPVYDPTWLPRLLRQDHLVRVLARTPEKKCVLLTENGCCLPLEQRPLICRLHPYTYTEHGPMGIDPSCPISKSPDGLALLESMQMPVSRAKGWVTLLYEELQESRPSVTA